MSGHVPFLVHPTTFLQESTLPVIQESLRHIDRLMAQRPASRTALKPYRELVVLMEQEPPERISLELKKNLRQIERREGSPLFSRGDLPVDMEAAGRLMKKFLAHFSKTNRNDAESLNKALQHLSLDGTWAKKLFGAILKQDDQKLGQISKEVGLAPQTLLFLGETALKPSLHLLRDTVTGNMDNAKWPHGFCPLCGSQPDMAFFLKTGKRYLHCGLCGEQWPYARVKCPFCNTKNQAKLGYFEAEQEEGFRVYFCRDCGRYIKTIDKKAFEEVAPLELENLATIHLDLLARNHGFQ